MLEAATDPPAVVLIEGEGGIGKTRLVQELLARPELRHRQRLLGGCQQLSEPFPLGPLVEALREASLATGALSPVAGALRPLLPELADRLPALPEPLGDRRAERHRLFRAVRELLGALGSAVVVLEDLHWADEATVELLRFLAPQLPPGLALLCTYRREDLPEGSALPGLALPARGGAYVTLQPLARTQVRDLVRTILGTEEVSQEFADYLFEGSGGLPFAVEEVLRLLEDREDLVRRNGLWVRRDLEDIGVPKALRDSLLERLGRLTAQGQDVLQAAAVLGVPISERVLVEVAGLSDAAAGRVLAEALSSALLLEVGEGGYAFRHALARQAVEEAVPPPLRRRLHLRAAAALEAVDPRPLARLAHHYRVAGETKAWIVYAEAAADRASSLQDDTTAYGLLKDALAVTGLPAATRARLANKLTTHAIYSLNHEEAIAVLRRMADDETLPRGLRGEMRFSLGSLLFEAGDIAGSYAEIVKSTHDLARRPGRRAQAMSQLAQPWASPDVRVEEHLGWLDQAVNAAAGLRDPEVRTKVAVDRAITLLTFGDPRGWDAIEEIPEPGTTPSEMKHAVRACNNLADAMIHLGYYQPAEQRIGEGLRLSAAAAYERGTIALRITSLELDWVVGNWYGLLDRARSYAEAAEEWALFRRDVDAIVGLTLLSQGKVRSALRLLEPLSRDFLTSPALLSWAAGGVARIRLAEGKSDAALGAANRALDVVERKGIWTWAADVAPIAVEALLAADRQPEATRLRHRFANGFQQRWAPAASAALAACDALLTEVHEGAERAADAHLAVERAWLALPRRYEAARERESAGRCLLPAHVERAQVLLVDAMDEFRRLGATWDTARVTGTLRAHGLIPPNRRGRRGYGDELSPREAQVAHLASEGLTNREIAVTLFLSQKTVERYLGAVMRKLGVASRTEIAARLVQDPSSE